MMHSSSSSPAWFGSSLILLFFASVPIALLYRSYLKLSFHACFGLVVAAFALGFWTTNERIGMLKAQGGWRTVRPKFG